MSEERLKNCPLCDGKASYIEYCRMSEVSIRCKECKLETGDGTKEYVTKQWNTRTPNPNAKVLEMVEELISSISVINGLSYHNTMKRLTKIKNELKGEKS